MNVVGIILSYNVPEVTDRLYENLLERIQGRFPLVVFDNGSDEGKLSQYTTHCTYKNSRMTGGFNSALQVARFLDDGREPDAVWFFTNDCYFVTDTDPLANAITRLQQYPDIGILHPAADRRVKCCFDVHRERPQGVKIVSMYDFVCPLFTRRALELLHWRLNPELKLGWGIDFETSYLIRSAGMKVARNDDVATMHETSTTYDRGRDATYGDRTAFYGAALAEMRAVLSRKYGPDWEPRFYREFQEDVDTWRA